MKQGQAFDAETRERLTERGRNLIALGRTLTQAASELGISISTLSVWLRGQSYNKKKPPPRRYADKGSRSAGPFGK